MGQLVITLDDDRASDGPEMSCLTDQQRAFVICMTTTVGKDGRPDPKRAALAAGYTTPGKGHALMRHPRVLSALREEAGKRLLGATLIGIETMISIAGDPTHKDQFQAAKHLAKLNGFVEEQKVVVEHKNPDQAAMVERIVANAKLLGLDPKELLGQAGIVIDAEFEVVTPAAEQEDWSV